MESNIVYASSAVILACIGGLMFELYRLNAKVARMEEDIKWIKYYLLNNDSKRE